MAVDGKQILFAAPNEQHRCPRHPHPCTGIRSTGFGEYIDSVLAASNSIPIVNDLEPQGGSYAVVYSVKLVSLRQTGSLCCNVPVDSDPGGGTHYILGNG